MWGDLFFREDGFGLGGEFLLLVVGELHVLECCGGRVDEILHLFVVLGGGELGGEVFVGGEGRDGAEEVLVARKVGEEVLVAGERLDVFEEVFVGEDFVENAHDDMI